jgi:hypothetical protein
LTGSIKCDGRVLKLKKRLALNIQMANIRYISPGYAYL